MWNECSFLVLRRSYEEQVLLYVQYHQENSEKEYVTDLAFLGKNTLETSGEDVKLHSKRVEKM